MAEKKEYPAPAGPSPDTQDHFAVDHPSDDEDSRPSLGEEPADENLPAANHPTVAFLIPFPPTLRPPSKKNAKVPPFMMYAPLAAPLPPLKEGEKESYKNKAVRKWEKEQKEAHDKGTGFKAKAVGLIAKGMSATKNSRIEFLIRTPNKKKLKEVRGSPFCLMTPLITCRIIITASICVSSFLAGRACQTGVHRTRQVCQEGCDHERRDIDQPRTVCARIRLPYLHSRTIRDHRSMVSILMDWRCSCDRDRKSRHVLRTADKFYT